MGLLDVEPKQIIDVHYKIFFYRNTNKESDFKVPFPFFFLLFQISGAWFSQAGLIFLFSS